MGDIIVGGKRYPVLGPVLNWHNHGIEFRAGEGHNKRRKQEIDLSVFHWTGSENSPRIMASVLKKRELGVEFAIDQDGTIWQFCDPLITDTADAGLVNARSVGTEIVNYGFTWGKDRKVPKKGMKRSLYKTILNGRTRTFAHFWPAQIAAALSLADALSSALPIPRQVPLFSGGYWVENETLKPDRLASFKGHVGHYHITNRKSDPGLDLLEALRCSFASEL